MKLYITRHAKTNGNVSGILSSRIDADIHLNDEGLRQAEQLAGSLKNVRIDAIFVSELRRTRQTADIVNRFHHAPIITDPLLNELRTGYEGKPVGEWQAAIKASDDMWNDRFDGGEGLNNAAKRTIAFLDAVKKTEYAAVLIVTHGFIVQLMSAIMHGKRYTDAFDFTIAQGSYEVFDLS